MAWRRRRRFHSIGTGEEEEEVVVVVMVVMAGVEGVEGETMTTMLKWRMQVKRLKV